MRRWPSVCCVERRICPRGGLVVVVCLLLALIPTPQGRAAFERAATAARPAALASYASCPDIGASHLSSEGVPVSQAPRWVLGASAFELFGLSELRGYGLRLERQGALSVLVAAEQFGSEVYVERSLSVGIGCSSEDGRRAGLDVRALGLSAAGGRAAWSCAVDASAGARILDRLDISCRWRNVGEARVRSSPVSSFTTLAASLRTGSSLVTGSVLIERGLDPSSSIGCEHEVSPWLVLRAGLGIDPGLFAAGLGFRVFDRVPAAGGCVVDLAWQWHPELGASSFVSLSFGRTPRSDGGRGGGTGLRTGNGRRRRRRCDVDGRGGQCRVLRP
jgi:hypothetical protein